MKLKKSKYISAFAKNYEINLKHWR